MRGKQTETTTASTVVAESSEVAVNTTAAAPEVDTATADGLDFSMVSSVSVGGGGGGVKITIQPSTEPFVSTLPADVDFATPIVDGESLTILLYGGAAEGKSPELQIGLPPDQVKSISLASSSDILNGFTSVEKLEVLPSTKVQADLSSNTNPDLQVLIQTLGEVDVIADVVGYVKVGTISNVNIQAETVSEVYVEGSTHLSVDGNVGSGIVTSASSLDVSGDIFGHIDASSSSHVTANTISGSVKVSWSSTATASSCENVEVVKFSSSDCVKKRATNGGPLGSSITIATSAVMMFATLLVL